MTTELLNPNHARRLSVTCRYIDKLLADAEDALHIASSNRPFPEYIPDVSSPQQRGIQSRIARIRSGLVRALHQLGVEPPEPSIPVSRLLHTNCTFAAIAIEELKPRYMRGYGEVSPVAAAQLERITDQLKELVSELDHYLKTSLSGETAAHS